MNFKIRKSNFGINKVVLAINYAKKMEEFIPDFTNEVKVINLNFQQIEIAFDECFNERRYQTIDV